MNEAAEVQIEITAGGILLNSKAVSWDQVNTGHGHFHVLMNHRSYRCEVVSADAAAKSFLIKVNGHLHQVAVKDRFDQLLQQLGIDKTAVHKARVIKAPMPGLVLKILVNEQQTLNEGDSVLILEAMKMENVIKSPGAGVVKSIRVKEKDAVEKNHILIELA